MESKFPIIILFVGTFYNVKFMFAVYKTATAVNDSDDNYLSYYNLVLRSHSFQCYSLLLYYSYCLKQQWTILFTLHCMYNFFVRIFFSQFGFISFVVVFDRSQPIGEQFYDNFATAGVPVVCVTTHESSYYHGDDSDEEDQHILPVSKLMISLTL